MLEPLEGRQLLSTYYVSPSGSDSSSGTSASAPWKTITRVNNATLRAGDKVLFQGGKSFSGSLYVPSKEGGNASSAVTFSTYGSGRATINSGSKPGIDVAQTGGVHISNLKFVGSGMYNNSATGIWVHIDWANKDVSNFKINNVEVTGYGREGIRFMIAGNGSSLSNSSVTNVETHDNLYAGLKLTGDSHNSNKNWVIERVRAYNNIGSKSAGDVTGSGIFVADVENARISRCVAFNNGRDGAAPVGIWVAGSNRVTVEYCESYDNHTRNATDGGGFDFDWDVHNSVMQYNYSHGNDGPGYLLCAATKAGSNNTIRFNVSENDGRKNGRAGIQLYGNVSGADIYNNVVYISATGHSGTSAFWAHDSGTGSKRPQNVNVRNNIFVTTGGAKIVNLTQGVAQHGSIKFSGNAYHSSGGTFKIQWGGSSYSTLSAWRSAKGQEKLNGVATGYQGDPKLVAAGKGGTVGNADALASELTAYKLQSSSPLINKGVSVATFLASAGKDFYGDALPKGGKYDIGIDEVA